MIKQLSIGASLIILIACINTESADKHSIIRTQWTEDSTSYFRLKAQQGVRTEGKLKATGEKMEGIQRELLTMLNETEKQRLTVYFLKDRKTLTSYTGFPANGYTDTENGTIYFVDKDPFHLALRHELMHALSWRLWGRPKGYWLSEGIAVFASGSCGGYPFHALAQAIAAEGKLTSFENLTDTFDFKALEPSLQAASMVKYIYDTYGVAKLKAIWQNGWQSAQQFIGISPGELQTKWLNYIRQPEHHVTINWERIHESGCE